MIQDLMRKHKRAVMFITLAFVIVPFVYWGGNFGSSGSSRNEASRLANEPVAVVEGQAIPAALFRQALNQQLEQMRRGNPDVTVEDLEKDGTARKILERMVDEYILDYDAAATGLEFDRKLLDEQLKKDPRFQTDGKFDKELWNSWVEDSSGVNWNEQYASLAQNLRQNVVIQRVMSSARVTDNEVRQRFTENNTMLKVRYVAIDPVVTPTEEQIQAQYKDNPERYEEPEQLRAEFAAVSLRADKPAIVDEIVQRAQSGEDFGELAKQYSEDPMKEQGGAFDWRSENPNMPEYQKAIFTTPVGIVSSAIEGPGNSYYIYKPEEERTGAETGQREVKGRQIIIRAKLAEEETAKRTAQAEAIAKKALETNDLAAAAAEAGLTVQQTGFYSQKSFEGDVVPRSDSWTFRNGTSSLGLNQISEVIKGTENLYVARVVEVIPAKPIPIEKVRQRVDLDTVNAIKRTPEHIKKIADIAKEIKENAKSIADIAASHPELAVQPEESPEFSVASFAPGMGPLWNPEEVLKAVGKGKPGAFGGPIISPYTGEVYFVELISATPPAQSVFDEKFAEQEPNIRKALLTEAQNDRIEDYFAERRLTAKWSVDEEVYQYLVKPEKEQEEAPAATEDSAPESGAESSAPAEAPAATGEPAKPEATPAEPAAAPVESAPAPQPAS